MINHSTCDHPRTSGARAKCRRAAGGDTAPRKERKGATPRVIGEDEDDRYGQTPRDRHMECDKCGVERIAYIGTDPVTNIKLYVGEKCLWYIKRAEDLAPLDW